MTTFVVLAVLKGFITVLVKTMGRFQPGDNAFQPVGELTLPFVAAFGVSRGILALPRRNYGSFLTGG